MTDRGNEETEILNAVLNDPERLAEYKTPYDNYVTSAVPRVLGEFLVACGNIVYGEAPSYLKFRAVEVIARVPYHSWASAAYTLLTMFYGDEEKALKLSAITKFSRFAQDNETMHVVVVSCLAKREGGGDPIRHTLIPLLFAFFYYWASYILYILKPRLSFELNYLFEDHAYRQYSQFIETHREELKVRPIDSKFLRRYGRNPRSELEFFELVRNDELVHRNQSLSAMRA